MSIKALIFDVDGTLAETEEYHRIAFNQAFRDFGLDWEWSVSDYTELLKITGGKERIRSFIHQINAAVELDIAALHKHKTALYTDFVNRGDVQLRRGVRPLLLSSRELGYKLGIATTTSRANVLSLLSSTLGSDSIDWFDAICCGEDVSHKKPDPEVYLNVLKALECPAKNCLAFEDSHAGLVSARAANLRVVVTPSRYTAHHCFKGADWIIKDLMCLPELSHV